MSLKQNDEFLESVKEAEEEYSNSTEDQRSYIADFIVRNKEDYEYFKTICDQTPRNNKKYPNENADYTKPILADRLNRLTKKEAHYFIEAYINGTKGYHTLTARKILLSKIK